MDGFLFILSEWTTIKKYFTYIRQWWFFYARRRIHQLCNVQHILYFTRLKPPTSISPPNIAGHMSLMLPTWQLCVQRKEQFSAALPIDSSLPLELVALERLTRQFTAQTHWELSTSLTTNHLISIISLSSTLMSMNNASFVPEQERNRKLQRG